jgi:UDP-N-acetylmuramate: L-alanyl-gamma-D-glutamyl-meso-diaminopimelate ligase
MEHDHIDIYPTFTDYQDAFRRFIELVPETGLIVANAGDATVVELLRQHAKARVSFFAIEGEPLHTAPHWLAAPAGVDAKGTSFDVYAGGVHAGRFLSPLYGHHNLRNVIAAIGACAEGFNVRLEMLRKALLFFEGVKRRQELLGMPKGIFVYDDFAHHPTAVSETLYALRMRHPGSRVFAVFEPRSATACRKIHQQEYATSFASADHLLLAPLGRELPERERLNRDSIVSALRATGKKAEASASIDAIIENLTRETQAGDVIAILSNGGFGGIHQKLLSALAAKP